MTHGIKQPVPKDNFNVNYICRYEHEIDRQLVIETMGHYIESILGVSKHDVLFVKIPMNAVNQVFKQCLDFPGEEVEFVIDYRRNNVKRRVELSYDDLPCIWSVLENVETGVKMITTIEPCKFIIRAQDYDTLCDILKNVEIASRNYDVDALDKVHWSENTAILRKDFEFFASSRKWFHDKGISYNRSYLLYGPPGNGKTTTIKSFAKYLNVTPEIFDFTENKSDKDFQAWILGESERISREELEYSLAEKKYGSGSEDEEFDEESPTPLRLLVLEDLDRFFPASGEKHTQISLSCILNSLDGIIERKNTIIIATANHPENLDRQVLIRPGRFDKQVFYEHPSKEHARKFLLSLFKDEQVSEETIETAVNALSGHSYAFHKELFTSSASYAFSRTSTLINDDDVLSSLRDIEKNTPMNTMKSEKKKFGF